MITVLQDQFKSQLNTSLPVHAQSFPSVSWNYTEKTMAEIPKEIIDCPEYFNFAVDVVDNWAAKTPSPQALLWVDQNGQNPLSLDYAYFSQRSHRAAELLARLGVQKGDRVIIILTRVPAW